MPIFYSEREARLVQHVTPGNVEGYITYPSDRAAEVLWARYPDGSMFHTNDLRIGQPHFFLKGRAWHKVEEIPENAEWCGHYKPLD